MPKTRPYSKTRPYFLVLFFIFSTTFNSLLAQQHTYAVSLGGKEIGEIAASLTESEGNEVYEILSDVTFKVLWKSYNRKTSNLVTYNDKSLQTSTSGIYMNSDLEDSATMKLNQQEYHCYRYPDERFICNDKDVNFTTAKLYFQEPVGLERIYSERFLEYCVIELEGDHKYKLHLPNGKVNYYTYADNSLVEVFIDRTWFNLKFRRK